MRHTVDLSENAPWKERFRASSIRTSCIALHAPTRGLIANNASGSLQWYAWDVPSGNLRQITRTPGGHPMHLTLSANGRYIYYLRDQQGNEIGHFVRAPYDGGEPEDLTPELPSYSASSIVVSDSADRLAFIAARDNRFYVYCMEQHADGALDPARLIYESGRMIHGVSLSADGRVLVIASSERSGRFEFDLLAFDTTTGAQIASLCEPDGNSLELGPASHNPADSRFLATTTRSGIERLLIWDARSGARTDLDLPDAPGAMSPFDWSPDGRAILFSTVDKAEARLYVHSLVGGETRHVDYGSGKCATGHRPALGFFPVVRWPASAGMAGCAQREWAFPYHSFHARRPYGSADEHLLGASAGVAGPWFRLSLFELSRVHHLRARLRAQDMG
jgi:Tol biopolymer transport system component